MYLAEEIQNKWAPVLDHDALGTIKDAHRRSVTAIMLENTERALMESGAHGQYQTLTETSASPFAAGPNITINTASNGQVSVTGSIGGTNTQIQYNNN